MCVCVCVCVCVLIWPSVYRSLCLPACLSVLQTQTHKLHRECHDFRLMCRTISKSTSSFFTQKADDGCSSACIVEKGWICQLNSSTSPSSTVVMPDTCKTVCGNGVQTKDEQCDDGNVMNADGCSRACQVEDGWLCTPPLGQELSSAILSHIFVTKKSCFSFHINHSHARNKHEPICSLSAENS